MSFLAEAHADWHAVNGKYSVCDLDCGAGEHLWEMFAEDAEALKALEDSGLHGIKCGSCKQYHASKATVKLCCEVEYDSRKKF